MIADNAIKAPNGSYRYRPVLFFVLTYFFTWIFWIPAAFVPEDLGAGFMMIGLIAPAVVSTIFVLASGSDVLKQDLKDKIIGFHKVKWQNVLLAILVFGGIVAVSILLSLPFGQSLKQFSLTEDFSFTGVGIGSALITVTLASIIEEVGWKGYCEDSIGNYMNWFWESMIFGVLWSFWHFPLLFIKGTYQAGSILACMVFHLTVNFMQEKIAMTPETKCVETVIVIVAAAIIVLANREMFFGTKHVGRLLETLREQKA